LLYIINNIFSVRKERWVVINVTEKAQEELLPLLKENQGKLLRVHFKGFG
jgi:hypothetical protein